MGGAEATGTTFGGTGDGRRAELEELVAALNVPEVLATDEGGSDGVVEGTVVELGGAGLNVGGDGDAARAEGSLGVRRGRGRGDGRRGGEEDDAGGEGGEEADHCGGLLRGREEVKSVG